MTVGQLAAGAAALGPLVALGSPSLVSWAGRRLPGDGRGAALIGALALVPVVVAWLLNEIDAVALVPWGAYLAAPLLIAATGRAPLSPIRLLALLLALVVPIGLGLVPPVAAELLSTSPHLVTGIIATELGLSIVLIYRPTPGFGYQLRLPSGHVRLAIASFASFGAVAIPLGWLMGFLAPGVGVRSAASALASAGIAFFCIALPEELVFRGLLQQSLEQLAGARVGLACASVIFGLSHLGHPPIPNWRYTLLASLAGLAYGYVYQRTRSITASALTHALVDWTWFVLLAGQGIP